MGLIDDAKNLVSGHKDKAKDVVEGPVARSCGDVERPQEQER